MIKHPAKPKDAPPSPGADPERRILDAAHTVFIKRGTAGARMQEIADEAGVNKALLHYYYRSKSQLAAAVFQQVARGVFARVAEVAVADLELEDKVRRIIAIYLDQLAKSPYAPAYVLSELNQHPERVQQFMDMVAQLANGVTPWAFAARLEQQIDERVRAKTMRPMSAHQFLANLVSLCIFPFAARPLLCGVLGLDDREFRDFIEERKTALPDFFLNAIRP